jgi:TrfA protein
MADPKPAPEFQDPELAAMLDRFRATIAANPPKDDPKPPTPAKVIQLPLWPEAAPGMPNPVIRSALFPAIKSKDRQWFKRAKIAALEGVEIIYSGEQLNQQDFDVAVAVFNLARNHPLGTVCHSSAHGLLRKLQWATGNEQHVQLHETLLRLTNTFQVIGRRYEFFGAVIDGGIRDKLTKRYKLRVNPEIHILFGQGWTQIDIETRRKLRRKPLALWLQTQYASHAKPLPYSVELLRDLSGSRTQNLKHFRAALRRALAELQATGAIAAWEIDGGDLVRVYNVPTITQRRRGRPRKLADIAADNIAARQHPTKRR